MVSVVLLKDSLLLFNADAYLKEPYWMLSVVCTGWYCKVAMDYSLATCGRMLVVMVPIRGEYYTQAKHDTRKFIWCFITWTEA